MGEKHEETIRVKGQAQQAEEEEEEAGGCKEKLNGTSFTFQRDGYPKRSFTYFIL